MLEWICSQHLHAGESLNRKSLNCPLHKYGLYKSVAKRVIFESKAYFILFGQHVYIQTQTY